MSSMKADTPVIRSTAHNLLTVNDGTSLGGGRGTEMEGVVDKECHWKGPEGPGRDEVGEEGGGGIG